MSFFHQRSSALGYLMLMDIYIYIYGYIRLYEHNSLTILISIAIIFTERHPGHIAPAAGEEDAATAHRRGEGGQVAQVHRDLHGFHRWMWPALPALGVKIGDSTWIPGILGENSWESMGRFRKIW